MAESEEELKILLMKVNVGLTLNIQETKIMASGPITSWQINGETVRETLFWGAPKSLQMVTAAMKLKDAYSLEEKLSHHHDYLSHEDPFCTVLLCILATS